MLHGRWKEPADAAYRSRRSVVATGFSYYAWFGVDEAWLSRVLSAAMDRGADYADLFFEHSRSGSISLEDGIIIYDKDSDPYFVSALPSLEPQPPTRSEARAVAEKTLAGYERLLGSGGAILHFREALRFRPGSAETLMNLGEALEARGESDEAQRHIREARRLKPDLPLSLVMEEGDG